MTSKTFKAARGGGSAPRGGGVGFSDNAEQLLVFSYMELGESCPPAAGGHVQILSKSARGGQGREGGVWNYEIPRF